MSAVIICHNSLSYIIKAEKQPSTEIKKISWNMTLCPLSLSKYSILLSSIEFSKYNRKNTLRTGIFGKKKYWVEECQLLTLHWVPKANV